MNAIEQNKFFQNEFTLFLMPEPVAMFWDKYLNEVDENKPGVLFDNDKATLELFMHRNLMQARDNHYNH